MILGRRVLSLKALGVARPETFDFVTKPPRHALLRALETLRRAKL